MKRAISIIVGAIPSVLLLLALNVPAQGQSPRGTGRQRSTLDYVAQQYPPPSYLGQRIPNIDGMWYNHSNGGRCQVIQRRPDGQARFINETGDQARGSIQGDRVDIPDWNNGQGLSGWIRGDRIVWPDGNYWER
jgi:hypothetical protein